MAKQMSKQKTKVQEFVADFETTTTETKTHVWAYAICEVGKPDNVIIGTTIDDFMSWCKEQNNVRVHFHNLKFDGQFILYWLFKNGYTHTSEKKERKSKTFNTLISDKGLYYAIEVVFHRGNKTTKKVTFWDSLKLIPLSVEQIAKSFKMQISKLTIDYDRHNSLPEGSPLTQEEIDYITNDVKIVAVALDYFRKQGLDKMTIGSCAMDEYKKIISDSAFKRWYPEPFYHEDVKQSYRGGFTYLNPKFKGKTVGNGLVYDINSLYPSVMRFEYLPFGTPVFFEGKYEYDPIFPLYTQMLSCSFKIKEGKIPTIQIKHSGFFRGTEYLTSSEDEEVVICLNSVDLKLFFEHYDVTNVEYLSGWKFKCAKGLFNQYIDKWNDAKVKAGKEGNHGLRLIAKLFLNSLYGKFGSDNKVRSKIPYFGEDGLVHFEDGDFEEKKPVYIAMASFITSYARYKTITSAQKIQDDYNAGKSNIQFIYADTDSLHLSSPDFEEPDIDIDGFRLGAWKKECKFIKGKFLRAKCYMELSTEDFESDNPEYSQKVTVAGMPKGCHEQVTFRNFKIGATYNGKLQPKTVDGGVVLKEVDFTIKDI